MNGLIQKLNHFIKKVVLKSITKKYHNASLTGRLQYLQELVDLIDHSKLVPNIRELDAIEVVSTKFNDIKGYSRNVAVVVQQLKANQNIDFHVIKTDPVNKNAIAFMMTSDSSYIDPEPYVKTIIEYSVQIRAYVENTTDKQGTIYIHNTYLLLYYVEDLISFVRELVRISNR